MKSSHIILLVAWHHQWNKRLSLNVQLEKICNHIKMLTNLSHLDCEICGKSITLLLQDPT